MANLKKKLATNVDGDFYVDSTCIDCGTCRWMASSVFDRRGEYSRVHHQPQTESEVLASLRALVACPVASIGVQENHDIRSVSESFPVLIDEDVYHCGYHHRRSFGAASYFIVRPEGNVLIDSPRFAGPLVKRIEALGGIQYLFLTHRDDVADHEKFSQRFGCQRILHADDVTPSTSRVEIQPEGKEPLELDHDLTLIPVPGHTQGSACLLYNGKYLFTGDHLAWSISMRQLYAFKNACWFDWPTQIESMRGLAAIDFEHVLPGHGAPYRADVSAMRDQMQTCIEWMTAA